MSESTSGSPSNSSDDDHATNAPRPVDPDTQCSVKTISGRHVGSRCPNRLTCKVHSAALKRAVEDRSKPFDELLGQQPANLAHATSSRVTIVDPDAHCAVISKSGRPCLQPLTCDRHTVEEKEQIPGRSASFRGLLATYMANNNRTSSRVNVDVQCAVRIAGGLRCAEDLLCSIHTHRQKAEVQRSEPLDDLTLIQCRQRLHLHQISGGYGLAVAAVRGNRQGVVGQLRRRYRRDGLQKASDTTHVHLEVAEPEFRELEPAGTNLENVRQMLYEYDNSSCKRDINDMLAAHNQQDIAADRTRVFLKDNHHHFCFASRKGFILPTFVGTAKKLATGGDKNACIISAPMSLFPLDTHSASVVLDRLRGLLQRLPYPLGFMPPKLKHLFLVHAIFMDAGSVPRFSLPIRADIVDEKPALIIDTTQLDPDTGVPYQTSVAIPLNETLGQPADSDPPDWFIYPGLERVCESLSISAEQIQIRLGLVKRIAYHVHLGIIKAEHLRWLLAQLSTTYDASLLIRTPNNDYQTHQPRSERLAIYDQASGTIQPSESVGRLAPFLPTIQVSDAEAAFLVQQCLDCRFMHSKDIFIAWVDACNSADLQETYGTTPFAGPCQCTPDQARVEFHDCRACGATSICCALTTIEKNGKEYRLCSRCVPPTKPPPGSPSSSSSSDSSPGKPRRQYRKGAYAPKSERSRVKGQISDRLNKEWVMIFPDKDAVSDILAREREEAYSSLLQRYRKDAVTGNSSWEDGYLATPITETEGPMACSVEALLPLVWTDKKPREHVASNLILTKRYANLLAGSQPSLVLLVYHRLDSAIDAQEKAELVQRLDNLHIIRSQIPWSGNKRLSSEFDEDFQQEFLQQCRTGVATMKGSEKVADQDTIAQPYMWRVSLAKAWTTKSESQLHDIRAVQRFIEELELSGDRQFHRVNGVSYPFQGGPEFEHWSWPYLYAFFGNRLDILKRACNLRSKKTVTITRLICAVFYLLYNGRAAQSSQLLDLPVCIYTRHPLSVSIGKDDHARHMGTGLSEELPLQFQTFRLEDCNLCIEPWTCNSAIGNREEWRDVIRNDFRENLRLDNPPFWSAQLQPLIPEVTKRYIINGRVASGEFHEEDPSGASPNAGSAGARAPPTVPQRRNMANLNATCYMSTTIQSLYAIDDFRGLIETESSLAYADQTGRPDAYYFPSDVVSATVSPDEAPVYRSRRINDAKLLFKGMRKLFTALNQGGKRLPASETQSTLQLLQRVVARYDNKTEESAQLLEIYLELAVASSDTSSPQSKGMLGRISEAQEQNNQVGLGPQPLDQEAAQYWTAFTHEGHTSVLVDQTFSQIIKEIACNQPQCPVIGRSFEHTAVIYLDFPSDSNDSSEYSLQELLDLWQYEELDLDSGWKCEKDPAHERGSQYFRCIMKASKYICFAIRRGHGSTVPVKRTCVMPPEVLDLSQYADATKLPSQSAVQGADAGNPAPTPLTYDLAVVNNWKDGPHYLAYVREWTDAEPSVYTMFNDLAGYPTRKTPFEGLAQGEIVHFAIYKRRAVPEKSPIASGQATPQPGEDAQGSAPEKSPIAPRQATPQPGKDAQVPDEDEGFQAPPGPADPLPGQAPGAARATGDPGSSLTHSRPTSSGTDAPPSKASRLHVSGDVGTHRDFERQQADLLKREADLQREKEDFEQARIHFQARQEREMKEISDRQQLLQKRQDEYEDLHYWAEQGKQLQHIKQQMATDLKHKRDGIMTAIATAKRRVNDAELVYNSSLGSIMERQSDLHDQSILCQQQINDHQQTVHRLLNETEQLQGTLSQLLNEIGQLDAERTDQADAHHRDLQHLTNEIERLEKELAKLFRQYEA